MAVGGGGRALTLLPLPFCREVADGEEVFPPYDLIFSTFNFTPLAEIKVVIIGQGKRLQSLSSLSLSL